MPRPLWATNKNLFHAIWSFIFFVFAALAILDRSLAIIFILAALVHEAGHIWAFYRFKVKLGKIFFLPLIGATLSPADKRGCPDEKSESWISIMGPLWGLGMAVMAFSIWLLTGSKVFGAACLFAALMNALNLAPIFPLDGGKIMRCLTHTFSPFYGLVVFILITAAFVVPLIVFGAFCVKIGLKVLALAPYLLGAAGILFLVVLSALLCAYQEIRQRRPLIRLEMTPREEKRAIFEARPWGPPQDILYQLEMRARHARNSKLKSKEAVVLLGAYFATVALLILLAMKTFEIGLLFTNIN